MTVEIFLTILVVCSALSSLLTEAVKKMIPNEKNIPYNWVVLIISMIVGIISVEIYYISTGVQFNMLNIAYMLFMGIANWVGAMVGYDKVKQAISQIKF